ncbi:uncharacterized protein BP5553_07327 [Venustampulla echinocandica]|uniref:Heme haloperoxidase family profile domain-containing protein n=1 Tax=Venustampulla echinocandica TaxID=2656787 RepID=A0A370TJ67_9HELO|nr:uncharacterized protein BP5553_07327 [Venustampulla echinocandica]RDL35396.1 hypothetical protein BP5553_07327 [Venustampulla echinocandica]
MAITWTLNNVVHALTTVLNLNESIATIMWQQAIIANPEPNATFFTLQASTTSLDQLKVHNLLEHDSSLSRSDAFFGNNHVVNQTIFDTSKAYFTDETMTATNSGYTFTKTNKAFSLGEMAALILMFGDLPTATVNRTIVEFFFENERLPSSLGWTKQANSITPEDVTRMSQIVSNVTSLITAHHR